MAAKGNCGGKVPQQITATLRTGAFVLSRAASQPIRCASSRNERVLLKEFRHRCRSSCSMHENMHAVFTGR